MLNWNCFTFLRSICWTVFKIIVFITIIPNHHTYFLRRFLNWWLLLWVSLNSKWVDYWPIWLMILWDQCLVRLGLEIIVCIFNSEGHWVVKFLLVLDNFLNFLLIKRTNIKSLSQILILFDLTWQTWQLPKRIDRLYSMHFLIADVGRILHNIPSLFIAFVNKVATCYPLTHNLRLFKSSFAH